ncbi:hypothetical protein HPB48_019967 [Haemaphysalis longicornis]|uniref:Uncharacterized protein n=1 Tax=Haemaphysalis longicornis TaxID=44386 RepID=A0A9J6GB25_HAELO|nr:hypothetical protein HPB48_019967 [Haemaphysalis longicornis]
MVDEILIKPFFDYKGANITGNAPNTSEAATRVMGFMVQSVVSRFKQFAHIVFVRCAAGNIRSFGVMRRSDTKSFES